MTKVVSNNFIILTKMKISEIIVGLYVISQLFFLGGREIAQEGGEMLRKVSPKLYAKSREHFMKSKFHQNRKTIHRSRHELN